MSPEPTQKIMDENLKVPQNVTMELQGVNESDSEDDEAGAHEYIPLSQVPTDSDVILDDDDDEDEEDDEWISNDNNTNDMIPVPNDDCTTKATPSELTQVWTTPCPVKIDLDADKINQVKTAMANFKLPTTAIPEWASSVTEEQWKDQLIDKIKKIQEK